MLKDKLFCRFDCFLDNLDDDEPQFEVISATVTEGLSIPYEITLQVYSSNLTFSPTDFIRKSGALILNFDDEQRYFHGVIGSFKQQQLITINEGETVCVYQMSLYPALWCLKFNQDYRIFQDKTTLEIVNLLLDEQQLVHVDQPHIPAGIIKHQHDPIRPYCVQYGESDFNFISRLLEDRGYYYYFKHHYKYHTLKLAYSHHDHSPCHVIDELELTDVGAEGFELNKISVCEIASRMAPSNYALMDYNYHHASNEMITPQQAPGNGGVIYEYPAGAVSAADSRLKTEHFVDYETANEVTLSGKSTAPFFSPGYKFTLLNHPNPQFDREIFTLESVTHQIHDPRFMPDGGVVYENTFTAFLSHRQYRPERKTPKPKIEGAQTAIVVSPNGEEVWTDEQGRVKVQFHWNHRGYKHPVIIRDPTTENDSDGYDTPSDQSITHHFPKHQLENIEE